MGWFDCLIVCKSRSVAGKNPKIPNLVSVGGRCGVREDTGCLVAALGAEAASRMRERAVFVGAVGEKLARGAGPFWRRRRPRHLGVLVVARRILAEHAKLARDTGVSTAG
jgi:hypothetical protein